MLRAESEDVTMKVPRLLQVGLHRLDACIDQDDRPR